jgi:hypothetical protein
VISYIIQSKFEGNYSLQQPLIQSKFEGNYLLQEQPRNFEWSFEKNDPHFGGSFIVIDHRPEENSNTNLFLNL